MIPKTYVHSGYQPQVVRVCSSCQWLSNAHCLALQKGRYQLLFKVAAYLRRSGDALPEIPFLDDVVINFGINDPTQHYHVPLLLSAYGYSTYRGS